MLATPRSSPTATNLLRAGVARVGVGPTRDVVLVDGRVTKGVDDATAAHDPTIKAYIARRIAEGKTSRDAVRLLKRYLARHLYRILTDQAPLMT